MNYSKPVLVTLLLGLAGCSSAPRDLAGQTEQAAVADVTSITKRPDGFFDVVCKDGSHQIASDAQIARQDVCNGRPAQTGDLPPSAGPDDPFAADACSSGDAWSVPTVEAKLPAGALSTLLPARIYARFASADCVLRSDGSTSCAPWRDLPVANLRQVNLSLRSDPAHHTAAVNISAGEGGMITAWLHSCSPGETGDLCPISLYQYEEDFSAAVYVDDVNQGVAVAKGYAGFSPRNPASILLGQAGRTAGPEENLSLGNSKVIKGYFLGSTSVYPSGLIDPLEVVLDESIPDSQKDFVAGSTRMTTTCALTVMTSVPPPSGTPRWTKTVGGMLFRF